MIAHILKVFNLIYLVNIAKFIFVDTCVWRHWFCHLCQSSNLSPVQIAESEFFQKIYDLVLNSDSMQFVFNQRIKDELGSNFAEDFQEKVFPFAKKIPIPLTRCDGAYKYDGSFLYGGNFGGALRDLLTIQGYNHPSELEKASSCLAPGDYLYNTKPRKKEFDIEHMESALECGAELFITNDKRTILNLLEQALAVKHYPAEHPIAYMHSIAKLPSIAWNILTSAIE